MRTDHFGIELLQLGILLISTTQVVIGHGDWSSRVVSNIADFTDNNFVDEHNKKMMAAGV